MYPVTERPAPSPGTSRRERLTTYARQRLRGSAAEEFVVRVREIDFVTTVTVVGAMFLLSALPLVILISSMANRRIEDDLSYHMGLNRQAAHIVHQLFRIPTHRPIGAVVIAIVLAVAGTFEIAGSVQRIYEQVFRLEPVRSKTLVRRLAWIGVLCGWLASGVAISDFTRHMPAHLFFETVMIAGAAYLFFIWSMRHLLAGRVSWRTASLPALVTAVLWLGLEGIAALYFSPTITSDSQLYGTVGVVFSLLTWFIAISAVVLIGALAGDIWRRRLGH